MSEHPVELSEEVAKIYQSFEADLNRGIHQNEKEYKALQKAIEKLKNDPECGDHLPAKQVSEKIIGDFGVNKNNVWRLEISGDWRAIYTLINGEVKLCSLILKVFFTHKEYENYVFK